MERLDVEQASKSDEQLSERQQDNLPTVFAIIQADVEHDGFMVGSLSGPQATVVDTSGQEELVFFLDGGLGWGHQEADAIGFGLHRPRASQVARHLACDILMVSDQFSVIPKQGLPLRGGTFILFEAIWRSSSVG